MDLMFFLHPKDKRTKLQNDKMTKRTKGQKNEGTNEQRGKNVPTKVIKYLWSVVLHLRDVYVLVFIGLGIW